MPKKDSFKSNPSLIEEESFFDIWGFQFVFFY
jgi:hypothetical protein